MSACSRGGCRAGAVRAAACSTAAHCDTVCRPAWNAGAEDALPTCEGVAASPCERGRRGLARLRQVAGVPGDVSVATCEGVGIEGLVDRSRRDTRVLDDVLYDLVPVAGWQVMRQYEAAHMNSLISLRGRWRLRPPGRQVRVHGETHLSATV